MSKSPENSINRPRYLSPPTMEEVDRLRLVVEKNSTGAHVHELRNYIQTMISTIEISDEKGWNQDKLKTYNDAKGRLQTRLSLWPLK